MRVKPGSQALMNSSRSVPVDARMTLTAPSLGWSLCTLLSPGVAVSVAVKWGNRGTTKSYHRRSEGSRRPDLNREPPDYKSGALPIAPRRR